jgi:formate dehydrogenase subunit gamma
MNVHVTGDIGARTLAIVSDLKGLEGPLLPILHEIQAEFGYVPQECLPVIVYHDYRDHPAGRHVLKLCRAEACQSMGGDEIAERVKSLLGIDFHQTTLDGAVTLEPIYCLGLCSCAPAAMLDGEVHGRVDADLARELVAEARR